MPHSYGLYPWTWNASESCHEPPQGAFAVLDLRPLSEQAVAGQSGGWGFFAWPDIVPGNGPNIAPPADLISLGYGDCRELLPTTAQRDELRTRLGLSTNPGGATLIDTISDCLGSLADPTGQSGPKPNMPTREGTIDLHLAYHSRVKSEAFAGGEMFATTAKGKANRIRDVIRGDLETAHQSGGPELVAKVLGLLCDRWGVSYTQAAKWRNLIRGPLLAELLGKSGGKFAPKKPRTSYSDDFNRADASTLGGSWTEYKPGSNTWEIVSNACRQIKPSTGGSTAIQGARYEYDVSSADHWVTVTMTAFSSTSANIRTGPAARFSSIAHTCYWSWCEGNTSSNGLDTYKIISGTATSLAIQSPSSTKTPPWTAKLDCSGSTISSYEGTTLRSTTTDTAITGNTRGGLSGSIVLSGTQYAQTDGLSIDDGVSAGGQPMALRTAGMRLGWARVGRGF